MEQLSDSEKITRILYILEGCGAGDKGLCERVADLEVKTNRLQSFVTAVTAIGTFAIGLLQFVNSWFHRG